MITEEQEKIAKIVLDSAAVDRLDKSARFKTFVKSVWHFKKLYLQEIERAICVP